MTDLGVVRGKRVDPDRIAAFREVQLHKIETADIQARKAFLNAANSETRVGDDKIQIIGDEANPIEDAFAKPKPLLRKADTCRGEWERCAPRTAWESSPSPDASMILRTAQTFGDASLSSAVAMPAASPVSAVAVCGVISMECANCSARRGSSTDTQSDWVFGIGFLLSRLSSLSSPGPENAVRVSLVFNAVTERSGR
jgi:hypothetical protein